MPYFAAAAAVSSSAREEGATWCFLHKSEVRHEISSVGVACLLKKQSLVIIIYIYMYAPLPPPCGLMLQVPYIQKITAPPTTTTTAVVVYEILYIYFFLFCQKKLPVNLPM